MKIRILGAHNTESRNTRMAGLLVDGKLALDAGSLTSSLTSEELLDLKAVLLSHQHYDHIRDIPALGMNLLAGRKSADVYCTQVVADVMKSRLFDGEIYPDFLKMPAENPALELQVIEPLKPFRVEEYEVLAVPVRHSRPTVGFQVTSGDGKSVFYTSDTGPGLSECWASVSPQLIIADITVSSRYGSTVADAGHLSPESLKEELLAFRDMKGYVPQVVAVHMSYQLEAEIKSEMSALGDELQADIRGGHEDMEISL